MVNSVVPGGYKGVSGLSSASWEDSKKLVSFYAQHAKDQTTIDQGFTELKAEAVKMRVIS
jgi:hypothetical protein